MASVGTSFCGISHLFLCWNLWLQLRQPTSLPDQLLPANLHPNQLLPLPHPDQLLPANLPPDLSAVRPAVALVAALAMARVGSSGAVVSSRTRWWCRLLTAAGGTFLQPASLLCGELHIPVLLPCGPCPGLLLPPILLWTVLLSCCRLQPAAASPPALSPSVSPPAESKAADFQLESSTSVHEVIISSTILNH